VRGGDRGDQPDCIQYEIYLRGGNAKIPGIVDAHAAKGEHVVMVDMSKLPSSQLNGVHPTDHGYATMAGYWYESIQGFLPN
jgi:hypothetical protein